MLWKDLFKMQRGPAQGSCRPECEVYEVCVQENENILVSSCGDGSVKVWDVAAPPASNPIRSMQEHTREVGGPALHLEVHSSRHVLQKFALSFNALHPHQTLLRAQKGDCHPPVLSRRMTSSQIMLAGLEHGDHVKDGRPSDRCTVW